MSVGGGIFTAAAIRRVAAIGAACACLAAAGCNKQTSTEGRIKQASEEAHLTSVTLYPFAGRVTIDNQTPSLKIRREALVVMAYDASKPDASAEQQPFAVARDDGSFDFPAGGLPAGRYVMLFAALDRKTKKKSTRVADGLNNLFNDPDVNGKKSEFTINHEAPGKTDYLFNLNVSGETPRAQPGPKALTRISN
jgi:hypothetical protein